MSSSAADSTTTRLYYGDSYLRRFQATARTGADPLRVYLDRTAFYPTSGGQPFDTGRIGDALVTDVVDEGDRIAHHVDRPVEDGAWLEGEIDWARRFDHMQQHTGQHLLSAVLADVFKIPTVSFHLGAESATIDVEAPRFEPAQLLDAERRANQAMAENRPVTVSYHDSRESLDLRKPPDREGQIRVVTIEGLDRSACGGTHVSSTAEAGPIFLRKLDRIRGNVRIEFVCGLRAVARARADYDALSSIARRFSAPLDETPALTASLSGRLAEAEKLARRLAGELAVVRGRELYAATAPVGQGLLRWQVREIAQGPIPDELRAEAQAFASAGSGAVFAALCSEPPSILLCLSADAPVKAGTVLKAALEKHGGRGGGSPTMAQGSVPAAEALAAVWSETAAAIRSGPAA